MAKPIACEESFVGSYTAVHRGRGWSKPTRMIELTLGEKRTWNGREGKWNPGDSFEFTFDSVHDAERVARQILAEVKLVKASQ